MWISFLKLDDEYIIYYPPFSSKYNHSYETKCKYIEVLKGIIYNEKSELKLFKGDKIKISPNQDYTPYTEEKESYLRVCVRSCDNLIDIVCK